jgi:CheY-like chemotaxis protein
MREARWVHMKSNRSFQPAGTIALIVDDDPSARRVVLTTVAELELSAAEARSAEDALAYLREHAPDVGFVFTKLELAGRADGLDLARIACLRWPWIKVLIPSRGERIHDVPGNVVFLPNPCCAADIRAQIDWEAARARTTLRQKQTRRLPSRSMNRDEVNRRLRLFGSTYVALALAAFLAWIPCTGASALARDETSRERIGGDDDPIIVPRAVALPQSQAFIDPETTGSIDRRSAKPSLRCDRFAFFLGREAESEFREVC